MILKFNAADASLVSVTDNRTGQSIQVPITNNSIPATALKKLSLRPSSSPSNRPEDEVEAGVRIYDPGYVI